MNQLESIDCKRDDKARRVLNVAPDRVANITAERLENGVSLEDLEAVNVPVFRYGTQITIHGVLPDFDDEARPGGYRAVFLNQNRSVGVRYAAIDAEKKKLIERACQAGKTQWHANSNSTGFEVSCLFCCHGEEDYTTAKAKAFAALRTIPTALFFGSAYAFALPYGAGFGACAAVGAVPLVGLWELIAFFSGFTNEADLSACEVAINDQYQKESAASHAEFVAAEQTRKAEHVAKWATICGHLTPLSIVPPNAVLLLHDAGGFCNDLKIKWETVRGRNYYTVLERNFETAYASRHLAKKGFPWGKTLAAGRVFQAPN